MSDEGRLYVKRHSPYAGNTFWLHYVYGDIANSAHDYEIWIGDKGLAQEWPALTRSAIQRGRKQMIQDGFLTPLDPPAPGRRARYRFEFKGHEELRIGDPPDDPNVSRGATRQEGRHVAQRHTNVSRGATRQGSSPSYRTEEETERAKMAGQKTKKESSGTEPPEALVLGADLESEPTATTRAKPDLVGFNEFWEAYPRRNGKRLGKAATQALWVKLNLTERRQAWRGAINYGRAVADGLQMSAKDPERFVKHRCWGDWQTPATADGVRNGNGRNGIHPEPVSTGRTWSPTDGTPMPEWLAAKMYGD